MKYHKCVSRLRNGLNKEFRTSCKHKWKKYILVKYKTLYTRHNTWIVQLYIRSQWYYKEHMIGLKIQCLKKNRHTNKLKTSKFESFLIAVAANCRKTWAANSPIHFWYFHSKIHFIFSICFEYSTTLALSSSFKSLFISAFSGKEYWDQTWMSFVSKLYQICQILDATFQGSKLWYLALYKNIEMFSSYVRLF